MLRRFPPRGGLGFVLLILAGLTAPAARSAPPSPAPPAPLPASPAPPPTVLPQVSVAAPALLPGSGIGQAQAPGAVSTLTGADIARTGVADALGALQAQVPGVSLGNGQGNPFQPDLQYRGYTVSPLDGTPQGLAVYLNGVRFNQPFADSVDWDLLPQIAIARLTLEGSNPVFGLNALGGALAIRLKNGFTWQGGRAELYGGSFGTIDANLEEGRRSGNTAAYLALNTLHSDGWRQLSSSDLHQAYADIGWRGARAEVHLDLLGADNRLNGPGTLPVQILNADPTAVFSAPNFTSNKFGQVALSGTWYLPASTTVKGLLYYDNFSQRIRNGNAADYAPCPADAAVLCTGGTTPLIGTGGAPIAAFLGAGPYSQLNLEAVDTNGYGAAAQVAHDGRLFGRRNRISLGVSFDGGQTMFTASTLAGGLIAPNGVFVGPGVTVDQPDGSVVPVRVGIATNYYGAWFAEVFHPTRALALSLAGRLNVATVDLADHQGTALDGNHSFVRFNPGAGLTWHVRPGLRLFASYAEANRVPTPSELSCASPASPCTLANFFVGDPGLKQVTSSTIELGGRGRLRLGGQAVLEWDADVFRSEDHNDIILVASATPGLDYFRNVGRTQRQGFELGLRLHTPRWRAWLDYAFTDATFQTALTLDSPLNPAADANGQIHVVPGDRLPGVPRQRLNLGLGYQATPAWRLGLSAVVASGQYLYGDEANLTPPTTPYIVLDLDTSYQVTPALQLFALMRNALDAQYTTYGTFSPTSEAPTPVAPGASQTRSLAPGTPLAVYAGLRLRF